jgi:hypothetical protein
VFPASGNIDSSALGSFSTSRKLTVSIVAAWEQDTRTFALLIAIWPRRPELLKATDCEAPSLGSRFVGQLIRMLG